MVFFDSAEKALNLVSPAIFFIKFMAEELFYIFMNPFLIPLQRKKIVGLLSDDFLSDFLLTSHGIDCDDMSLDFQKVQKFRDCCYFV